VVISNQKDFHVRQSYTYLGEINNLFISFKTQQIGQVQRNSSKKPRPSIPTQDIRPAPPVPSFVKKKVTHPLDGLTYQLSSNVKTDVSNSGDQGEPKMRIKGYDDILAEYFYDFSKEQSVIN